MIRFSGLLADWLSESRFYCFYVHWLSVGLYRICLQDVPKEACKVWQRQAPSTQSAGVQITPHIFFSQTELCDSDQTFHASTPHSQVTVRALRRRKFLVTYAFQLIRRSPKNRLSQRQLRDIHHPTFLGSAAPGETRGRGKETTWQTLRPEDLCRQLRTCLPARRVVSRKF